MDRVEDVTDLQTHLIVDRSDPGTGKHGSIRKVVVVIKQAFNIRNNWRKLTTRPSDNFAVLDGLRALSILWLICFHTLYLAAAVCNRKTQCPGHTNDQTYEKESLRVFWKGHLGVDVFFVLSGFLIAHFLIREQNANGHFSFLKYYARRALRILPVYYAVLLLLIAVADLPEEPYAWRNFFFIMNLFPLKEQFMTWTWSLSVEMQFYVTFPLFLWILFKIPQKFRLPFLVIFVITSFVIRAICLFASGLEIPHTGPDRGNLKWALWWQTIYTPPWTKFGSLYSGVTLAYIFHNTNWVVKAHQKKWPVVLCFLVFLGCAIYSIIPYEFHMSEWGTGFAVIYFICWRYVLSIGVCFLIFSTCGNSTIAKAIGWFFQWDMWYVLAQLSYSAFLLHPPIIVVCYTSQFVPIQYATGALYSYALFFALITFVVSTFFYLFIEAPFMNLRVGRLKRNNTGNLKEIELTKLSVD